MQHHGAAVQAAEHHEGPARAVPDTGHQKGQEKIQVATRRTTLVGPQRGVNIAHDKIAERNMPVAPDLSDIARPVGAVEIDGQPDTEHERGADGHVGVAAEVEIELERVGVGTDPGVYARADDAVLGAVDACHPGDQLVRDCHFLEHAGEENADTQREVVGLDRPQLFILQLRYQLAVMDDGPRDQLGEKADKQTVAQEAVLPGLTPVGIDNVGNLLECEKGDGQRQDDSVEVEAGAQRLIGDVDEEIRVFEIAQQPHVA